jgi:hypothetical protein
LIGWEAGRALSCDSAVPLDLNYRVKGGFLQITSADHELPLAADSFMIVGHCLLALVAAALGGAAGPLVAGKKGSL